MSQWAELVAAEAPLLSASGYALARYYKMALKNGREYEKNRNLSPEQFKDDPEHK